MTGNGSLVSLEMKQSSLLLFRVQNSRLAVPQRRLAFVLGCSRDLDQDAAVPPTYHGFVFPLVQTVTNLTRPVSDKTFCMQLRCNVYDASDQATDHPRCADNDDYRAKISFGHLRWSSTYLTPDCDRFSQAGSSLVPFPSQFPCDGDCNGCLI